MSPHQREGEDTWDRYTVTDMCVDLACCLDTLEQDTTCQYKNVVNTTYKRHNKRIRDPPKKFLEKAIFWGDMIFRGEVIFGEKPFLGRSHFLGEKPFRSSLINSRFDDDWQCLKR